MAPASLHTSVLRNFSADLFLLSTAGRRFCFVLGFFFYSCIVLQEHSGLVHTANINTCSLWTKKGTKPSTPPTPHPLFLLLALWELEYCFTSFLTCHSQDHSRKTRTMWPTCMLTGHTSQLTHVASLLSYFPHPVYFLAQGPNPQVGQRGSHHCYTSNAMDASISFLLHFSSLPCHHILTSAVLCQEFFLSGLTHKKQDECCKMFQVFSCLPLKNSLQSTTAYVSTLA